jgi:coenzyme F420-dependent glucose-6-phosphate dehydrogenase
MEEVAMIKVGYWLASELHGPGKLVSDAKRAEDIGFEYAMISDHYHPWLDDQGHSPFVWSVIGGIAHNTEWLRHGTGVTCPIMRTHPAIIAQAAATSATMMPGRFFLGVGTGENLNEHILGDKWPVVRDRIEMLEEAMELIRHLWTGELTSHRGKHFTVENARIYDLPEEPPLIMVAVSGERSTALAASVGDGLITSSLEPEAVSNFEQEGGNAKPRYGRFEVCWARDEQEARRMAYQYWRSTAIKGQAKTELALPAYFEQLATMLTEDDIAQQIVCGPDPAPHIEKFQRFAEAGYTHVSVHQVTPNQEDFFRFYENEILPALSRMGLTVAADRAAVAR